MIEKQLISYLTLKQFAELDSKKTVIVFPGQGVQEVGMGKDIYMCSPAARKTYNDTDKLTREEFGYSVIDLSFTGPVEELNNHSPSAIATLNEANGAAIFERLGPNYKPDAVAGYSLGELSAISCAIESVRFARFLRLTELRTQECSKINGGELAVFLNPKRLQGLTSDLTPILGEMLGYLRQTKGLYLSLSTSDTQFVVGGTNQVLDEAERRLEERRKKGNRDFLWRRLKEVKGPYHTPLLLDVQKRIRADLDSEGMPDASIDIIANTTRKRIRKGADIVEEILAHLISPVDWYGSLRALYREDEIRYVLEPGSKPLITKMSLKEGRVLLPVVDVEQDKVYAHVLMPEEEAYAA